jgi:hypothetical protein
MDIGAGPGPDRAHAKQKTHYVYDVRSGAIVSVHHFVAAHSTSEENRIAEAMKTSSEASGVPIEHLAILTDPEIQPGRGTLHVDPAAKKLLRKAVAFDPRIRP